MKSSCRELGNKKTRKHRIPIRWQRTDTGMRRLKSRRTWQEEGKIKIYPKEEYEPLHTEKCVIIWTICRRNNMHTSNNKDELIVGSWERRAGECELEEREKEKNVKLRVDCWPGKNRDSSKRALSIGGLKINLLSEKWKIWFSLCGYMQIWCGPSLVLPQGHNWGGKFKKTCWAHFWKRNQFGNIFGQ